MTSDIGIVSFLLIEPGRQLRFEVTSEYAYWRHIIFFNVRHFEIQYGPRELVNIHVDIVILAPLGSPFVNDKIRRKRLVGLLLCNFPGASNSCCDSNAVPLVFDKN